MQVISAARSLVAAYGAKNIRGKPNTMAGRLWYTRFSLAGVR